ncbi:cache domain-containing protein [Gynuella sunshinyii]|uniref:Signal transduction histidine kinase n=1 Tax=Gynuella sunshinyii YC6258 TaxID=1445510 RepID=A0A0C5VZ54_9GAMM|nr:cache domain-containing protein [Gynuella sunshinyii]AJQ95699.1 signal transduction histidine kinase [Gynuella sunshinyii YC6258]
MITNKITMLIIFFVLASWAQVAMASNEDRALELIDRAIAHIEANGIDQAKKDFMDPNGGFQDGELYVFVINYEGMMLIHSKTAALNGRDVLNMKDPTGTYFTKDMIAAVKQHPEGAETEYMWPHPETKKLSKKLAYSKKIPSMDAFVSVGVYQ